MGIKWGDVDVDLVSAVPVTDIEAGACKRDRVGCPGTIVRVGVTASSEISVTGRGPSVVAIVTLL